MREEEDVCGRRRAFQGEGRIWSKDLVSKGPEKAAQVQASSERNIRPRGPRPHLDDFGIN